MRAIGVFILVLAMASPALAGPENSVIGAKKLEQDMVHSAGVGYPSLMYEWWNRGGGSMDWALTGELVYGDWGAAIAGGRRTFSGAGNSRWVKIGLGINGILRWHLATMDKSKVTNDVAILFKPGILIAGNRADTFTFGIKGEIGAPFTIDVHDRVTVVTGGYLPIEGFINKDTGNFGIVPILIRMGVEIKANDKLAPWFFFDLGPGIRFGSGGSDAAFAWRIGAGTAFWGIMGKGGSSSPAAEEDDVVVVEEVVVE